MSRDFDGPLMKFCSSADPDGNDDPDPDPSGLSAAGWRRRTPLEDLQNHSDLS